MKDNGNIGEVVMRPVVLQFRCHWVFPQSQFCQGLNFEFLANH